LSTAKYIRLTNSPIDTHRASGIRMSIRQQEIEKQENEKQPTPPRTPVTFELSLCLSPPKMSRGHRERGSVRRTEYWTDDREAKMTTDSRYLGKREAPSFPIMETITARQKQSMPLGAHHLMRRNSSRPCSKRRSCSFDDSLPIPKILLRPRYYRDTDAPIFPKQCSSTIDIPKTDSASRNRSHRFRSYTFDGADMIGMFGGPATQVPSPSPDTPPSFGLSCLNQALPSYAQFSPLGSCSTDSPRFMQSFARPVPRHLTPKVALTKNLNSASASSANNAYGEGSGVGTICSSTNSAFETTSSTFAKSRASSVRTPSSCGASVTAESLGSFPEDYLLNDKWHNNIHPISASHQSFDSKESGKNPDFIQFDGSSGIDGGVLPFNEVRVMDERQIEFQTYEQS